MAFSSHAIRPLGSEVTPAGGACQNAFKRSAVELGFIRQSAFESSKTRIDMELYGSNLMGKKQRQLAKSQ